MARKARIASIRPGRAAGKAEVSDMAELIVSREGNPLRCTAAGLVPMPEPASCVHRPPVGYAGRFQAGEPGALFRPDDAISGDRGETQWHRAPNPTCVAPALFDRGLRRPPAVDRGRGGTQAAHLGTSTPEGKLT